MPTENMIIPPTPMTDANSRSPNITSALVVIAITKPTVINATERVRRKAAIAY
jgi:hypothetical protein